MNGAPETVEERTDRMTAIHSKIFQADSKKPTSKPTNAAKQGTDVKDRLVMEILDGRIPDSSRNNLTVAIMGVLVSAGWGGANGELLVRGGGWSGSCCFNRN